MVTERIFVPTVLSIWGIVIFLRLGVIIGQAGVLSTLAMFCLGYLTTLFTALSQAAIATNGSFGTGGLYYFISRTLGPEFGATTGLLLFFSNVSSAAMYLIAFQEPLFRAVGVDSGLYLRVLPEGQVRHPKLLIYLLLSPLCRSGEWYTSPRFF
jgi:potassium/chloride transporter 9